jgi:tetratricopeptide (TPR) repeat protein
MAFVMSVASHVFVHAQNAATSEALQTGIARIKAGDFDAAITMLNQVVTRASLDESGLVARAQLYKAEAYLGLGQHDYARTSVVLGLDADPAIAVDALDVSPALKALIGELRSMSDADPETAARSAETSGRYQDAFAAYLRAFQRLPDPAPAADDQRLRERIVTVVRRLDRTPEIPQQARAHFTKAMQFLDAEKLLGSAGVASSEAAAAELRRAVRLAPWWGDPAFRLAVVLQRLQRVDEAAANLELYRLADPEGYAAIHGAATGTPASKPPAAPDPAAAVVAASVVRSPATLYVYWPPQKNGGGRPKVLCDGHHVADLQARHYVALRVAAGPRTIGFHKNTFPFSFESGGTYYLRASAEGFPPKAFVRLMNAGEGMAEMREKGVTSNDPRRTYSAECTAGVSGRKR